MGIFKILWISAGNLATVDSREFLAGLRVLLTIKSIGDFAKAIKPPYNHRK